MRRQRISGARAERRTLLARRRLGTSTLAVALVAALVLLPSRSPSPVGAPSRQNVEPSGLTQGRLRSAVHGIQVMYGAGVSGSPDTAPANASSNAYEYVNFAPAQTYSTGQLLADYSTDLVTGDFNGDGLPDLAFANYYGGGVTVLINHHGAFPRATSYATAGLTTGVAVGNFTRDGNLDIVAVATANDQVIMLPGNGRGGFGTPIASPAFGGPRRVAVGDVDGDGNLDVVTANPKTHNVSVLLGKGNGRFVPANPVNIPVVGSGTYGPLGVTLANVDVSHPGVPDLVVGDGDAGAGDHDTISVFPNTGGGTFGTEGQNPLFNGYLSVDSVAVDDMNKDGNPDLVAPVQGCNGELAVLLGDGAGGFGRPSYTSSGCLDAAVADFNDDGNLDVTVGHVSPREELVWLGQGDGSLFDLAFPFATDPNGTPIAVIAADLNGDGKPDIATLNEVSDGGAGATISVLANTTPPQLTLDQMIGGGSFCLQCYLQQLQRGDQSQGLPVQTATGEFYHSWNDLMVPGRGLPLAFSRTYSSALASQDGPLGYGWADSYGMSLSFDATTRDATVQEQNGSQVTFTPDGHGGFAPPSNVLAMLTDDGGSFTFRRDADQVSYVFNGSGQLTSETDLNNNTTSFKYTDGNLATVTDQAGRTLTFTYGANGKIATVTDPAGRSMVFTYDDGDQLTGSAFVSSTGHIVASWEFTYDAGHHMLTMTDPRQGLTTNVYDGSNRVIQQTDAMSRVTTFGYTDDGNGTETTLVTDPLGKQIQYVYQNLLLAGVTRGFGTADAALTTYTYDPLTLGVATVTDPNGHTITTTYDDSGNVLTSTDALDRTTSYSYNSLNETLTLTDPKRVTTTDTYDTRGNLTSVSTPIGNSTSRTTYTYGDPQHTGDVTAMTDPNSNTWTYGYDTDGNQHSQADPLGNETVYGFDQIGRQISMTTPRGGLWRYRRDTFGDVTSTRDPLGDVTTSTFDANQNLTSTTDANKNTTRYIYDADDEPTTQIRKDAAGHTVQVLGTGYDADGNIVTQTNGLHNVTSYTYDALNRPSSVTDPLARITTFGYDPAGNRTSLLDPQGRTTSYGYDDANELTGIVYSDVTTPNVTYGYDPDGQRLKMTDGTGATSYVYDSLHRLTSDTQGDGSTVSYGYDLAGNLTSLIYPDGDPVTRSYDNAERLGSVTDWLGNSTTFGYDGDSNLTTQSYPNGVLGTFTFDLADRLASIDDSRGAHHLLHLNYTRDHVGQVKTEGTRSFGYDPLNRLITDSDPVTYGYDKADDITTIDTTGQQPEKLTYDNANELTGSSQGTTSTTFTYNPEGNRTSQTPSIGNAVTYTWDQANRLTSYERGRVHATYTYTGDGLRMDKTVGSKPLEAFTWDLAEGLPLIVRDGGTNYVTGPGELPLEQVNGTTVTYYHHDSLGSTRLLTEATGHRTARYTYDAYGSLKSRTGKVANPFLFAGQFSDTESGLQYLRSRYYDLATGQFLNFDPLLRTTGLPFAYVADDPINHFDPSGLRRDDQYPITLQIAFKPSFDCDFPYRICPVPVGTIRCDSQGACYYYETRNCPPWVRIRPGPFQMRGPFPSMGPPAQRCVAAEPIGWPVVCAHALPDPVDHGPEGGDAR